MRKNQMRSCYFLAVNKRGLCMILSMMMLLTFMPIAASATVVDSGKCGENATYTLDSDGLLTVSGTGDMDNFGFYSAPWESYKQQIKNAVVEEGITSISSFAFMDSSISNITIPSTVKTIAGYSFRNSKLKTVVLPEGVETIEDFAFIATPLKSISIANSVSSIGDKAFYGLSNLYVYLDYNSYAEEYFNSNTSVDNLICVTYENGGTLQISGRGSVDSSIDSTISKYADSIKKVEIKGLRGTIISCADFRRCKSLESVVLNNVTSIGGYSFSYCPINSLTISGNLEYIGESAFSGCNIKSLTIPGTVEHIGDSAFSGCKDLESLTISEGVTEIGSFAFLNCNSLINVTIPASVTKLGGNVGFFGECIFSGNKLSDVNVSPGNAVYSSVDGVLFSKDKTVLYYYPNAKKESLYEIPDSVQTIKSQAFWDREYLRKLIIPNSVKTIEDYAFSSSIQKGNKNLTDIYYKGTQEEWIALMQNVSYIPCNATIHYNAVGTAAPKIIGKPTLSGSTVTVNLSDVEYDSVLIAAAYSDGVLKDMQAAGLSAGDMSKTINISASGNDTLKVFIWDSFDSMNPLCEAGTV